MNASILTRYLILGLLVVLTACSPLVVVMQPTAQPTQIIIITATA